MAESLQTFCDICCDQVQVMQVNYTSYMFWAFTYTSFFLKLELRAKWWSQFCTLCTYWDSTRNNPGLKANGLNCFELYSQLHWTHFNTLAMHTVLTATWTVLYTSDSLMHEWCVFVWILLDTDSYVDGLVYLYMKIPFFWDVLLFIPTITCQRLGILQRFILLKLTC